MNANSKKSPRRPLAALVLILLCGLGIGCGNKNKRADQDLVSEKDPVRGFLAPIPADTPYAFVAVEPMPLTPMLGWLDGWAQTMQSFLPAVDDFLADEYVDPETKFMYALMQEMLPNLNAEGFKKLGLSPSPRVAFYGLGLLPAMRMDLEDPDAFRAFLQRVESRSGYKPQIETLGQTEFWSYRLGDDRVVMAILNRQLVMGWTVSAAAELFTEHLLGSKLPKPSMASDDRITALAQAHGLKRYGAGFIDLERLAQMMLEPGTGLHDQIHALVDDDGPEPASPECLADTRRILSAAPRLVFGYDDFTETRARFATGIELRNDLGARLDATRLPAPLIESEFARRAPVTAAFGFDVGQVLDIVNAELIAVRDNPFQCPWYASFNNVASEVTMMTAMVPSLLTNLRGGAVVLRNVRPDNTPAAAVPPDGSVDPMQPFQASSPPFKVDGIAVVNSADPAGLLAWLRTLAPEFEGVTPDPAGIPYPLPPSEFLTPFEMPHVILTKAALALTSGDGLAEEASRLLSTPATQPTFIGISYDMREMMAMLAEAGAPPNPIADLFFGRTAMEVEPRKNGIFVHVETAFPPARP